MYIKYFISVIFLLLLINIPSITGQTGNRVTAETITPAANPSVTPFPSVTASSSSLTPTPVAKVSPLSATQAPDSNAVPSATASSLTPGTDKTPVAEVSPLSVTQIPDSNAVPSATASSSSLTPTPVAQVSPLSATQAPDSNAVPSVTPGITSDPSVKFTVSGKKNVPVIFFGEELFSVNTALGPYSTEERVGIILNRLKKVSEDPSFDPEEIKVEIKDSYPCIIYKDIIIMTVSDEDGISAGLTGREVADKYARNIRHTLKTYKEERSFKTVIFGIIYSLIATLIFILLLITLDRILKLTYKKINSWHGSRISDIKVQKLVLLSGYRIVGVISRLLTSAGFIVKLIISYIYLSLMFSFFVWTRDFGARLLSYVLSGLNVIWMWILFYLPHLFFIFLVIAVTYYIIKFIKFIFVQLEKGTIEFPGFYKEWAQPTYMIVRFLIIALSIIIIFPYLPGYDSPAFKGISLFLGVLLSLGSTAVVSNIVAGIILIYMNAFRIGDRVKIGDVTGDIIEKTLLLTRIRTIKNVDITIPNAMILGGHITNYSSASQDPGLILNTTVTIGYDAPWKDVHKLLIDAALATEDILKEPAPFVLQTSLDDFYVSYQLNAYTNKPNSMAGIYSDLHRNIQDKFNEGGVEIMSPHYGAVRDGNQTTIPADYLPGNYTAPAFKIFHEGKPSQEIDKKA